MKNFVKSIECPNVVFVDCMKKAIKYTDDRKSMKLSEVYPSCHHVGKVCFIDNIFEKNIKFISDCINTNSGYHYLFGRSNGFAIREKSTIKAIVESKVFTLNNKIDILYSFSRNINYMDRDTVSYLLAWVLDTIEIYDDQSPRFIIDRCGFILGNILGFGIITPDQLDRIFVISNKNNIKLNIYRFSQNDNLREMIDTLERSIQLYGAERIAWTFVSSILRPDDLSDSFKSNYGKYINRYLLNMYYDMETGLAHYIDDRIFKELCDSIGIEFKDAIKRVNEVRNIAFYESLYDEGSLGSLSPTIVDLPEQYIVSRINKFSLNALKKILEIYLNLSYETSSIINSRIYMYEHNTCVFNIREKTDSFRSKIVDNADKFTEGRLHDSKDRIILN